MSACASLLAAIDQLSRNHHPYTWRKLSDDREQAPTRNPNTLGFDCAASVPGFFPAFSRWGFLPVLYLSGRCQFGSAAFQTNATVSMRLSLLPIQRCPHYAHTWHITDMSIQQYMGEGRGGASQQPWLNWKGLQRPHLKARH